MKYFFWQNSNNPTIVEFVKKKLRDLNDEFLHRLLVDIHRQCNSHVGMKTAGIAVQTMYVMQVVYDQNLVSVSATETKIEFPYRFWCRNFFCLNFPSSIFVLLYFEIQA